jgi:N-acylneuraminate cytidylyltransferase
MSIIAIIPARGGSKGIPRKNIKMIAGKPLIAHTIECAKKASCIDYVFVSTDDKEIAEISKKYGAIVIMRPAEISGDTASSEAALLYTLNRLRVDEYYPDITVFLQCTSPLTSPEDIEEVVKLVKNPHIDCAFAVASFHHFIWSHDVDGNVIEINHDKNVRQMRQDRHSNYIETGAIYAMKTEGFRNARHRFFGNLAMYRMPQERSIEIDTPTDFEIAEMLIRKRDRNKIKEMLPDKIEGIVFDFDGVFTDNRVLVTQEGQELVICSRSDGTGIAMLRELGIPMFVISGEVNPVVAERCKKLRLDCMQNSQRKIDVLNSWCESHNINPTNVIYIGNDINDKECLQTVGCGIIVNDAHPDVRSCAKIILSSNGGKDAIRELSDLIHEAYNEKNGRANKIDN